MNMVDWAIVIILGCAVVGGLIQGFFRSVCSMGGLILGLVIAAWNYSRLGAVLIPIARIPAIADTIAFYLSPWSSWPSSAFSATCWPAPSACWD